ncbi:MAG: RHS repeat-associated core domain-containing protein [Myxococcota bacterium]
MHERSRHPWLPARVAALAVVVLHLLPGLVLLEPLVAEATAPGPFDWELTRSIAPIPETATQTSTLRLEDAMPPAGRSGVEVVRSIRPTLTATIPPSENGEYDFAVFDLSGPGGTVTTVAEGKNWPSADWTPEPGRLRHGRTYYWVVQGLDGELQDPGTFRVDLQSDGGQASDDAGPVTVMLSSGEVVASLSDDLATSLVYRSTDAVGRAANETPLSLSDGWQFQTSLLQGPWARVEELSGGSVVIAHALDGTALRYSRGEDDAFHAPSAGEESADFAFPTLSVGGSGQYVMAEPGGGVSEFDVAGNVVTFTRGAADGEPELAQDIRWAGGRLSEVTDLNTQRQTRFHYLGDWDCPAAPSGFDRGHPNSPLCAIEYLDGVGQPRTTELHYVNGVLRRFVLHGGATYDFAYSPTGHLTHLREPFAADVVASGHRTNDPTTLWRIEYDDAGRVDTVTTPAPTVDESATQRRYAYDEGRTTVYLSPAGGTETQYLQVTYDPSDWKALSSRASLGTPEQYLYDADGHLYGKIGTTGLQETWHVDAFGRVVEQFGPAPAAWFDAAGRPLPSHEADVAHATRGYNLSPDTRGPLAFFYDSTNPGARVAAQRLLTSGAIDSLPPSMAGSGAWRALIVGRMLIDRTETTRWRLAAPDGNDDTTLAISGTVCALSEECEVPPAPAGEPATVWLDYRSNTRPASGSSVTLRLEQSDDEGESWVPVDLTDVIGLDLVTDATATDTYRLGDAPVSKRQTTHYEDPLLGLVSHLSVDGVVADRFSYESANPSAGQFARMVGTTLPSGLHIRYDHYAADEVASSKLTGEVFSQNGATKEVQVGDGPTYRAIHDDVGQVIQAYEDDIELVSRAFDPRGRPQYLEKPTGADPVLEPFRSTYFEYGVLGDPRKTMVTATVGARVFVDTSTVDLFGRVREHVDPSGIRATHTYDGLGLLTQVEYDREPGSPSPLGRFERHYNSDFTLAAEVFVDLFGRSHRADATAYDEHQRLKSVAYSNGTSLDIVHDPIRGTLEELNWTDGDGETWSESVVRSTQSGRILQHLFESREGDALFEYGYAPKTGYLAEAHLFDGGVLPALSWAYDYAYDAEGESACSGYNLQAALDGARTRRTTATPDVTVTLDYCYDGGDAPARVSETTTQEGSEPAIVSIPLELNDGAITKLDNTSLRYDREKALIAVDDGVTNVTYLRDATGRVLEETLTRGGETVVRRHRAGGLVLDGNDAVVGQSMGLLGGVMVVAQGSDLTWSYSNLQGSLWWRSDQAGAPVSEPAALYSPDGERVNAAGVANLDDWSDGYGWRFQSRGKTLPTDTLLIEFGARVYAPMLGAFTTADPIPNGGLTPYAYADNDAINFSDPEGTTAFDDAMTHPLAEVFIPIGLVLLSIASAALGAPWLAAFFSALLLAYDVYLTVYYFSQGENLLGSMYLVSAVFSLLSLVGSVRVGRLPDVNYFVQDRSLTKTFGVTFKSRRGRINWSRRHKVTDVRRHTRRTWGDQVGPEATVKGNYSKVYKDNSAARRYGIDIPDLDYISIRSYGPSYPLRMLDSGGNTIYLGLFGANVKFAHVARFFSFVDFFTRVGIRVYRPYHEPLDAF